LSPKADSRLRGLGWGALGGFLGAGLGHMAVMGLHRWAGDANLWLKGAHGPPFFDLALATGIFYACVGAALYPGAARRLFGAGVGLGAVLLALALPMALATRLFAWGEAEGPETYAWFYLVLGLYGAANAASAWLLGLFAGGWRRALAAVLGMTAAGLAHLAARMLVPELADRVEVIGVLPPPSALGTGMIWGGGLGFGMRFFETGEAS